MKTIKNTLFIFVVTVFCLSRAHAADNDLGAKWWRWVLAIPASQNPLTDETGEFCNVNQDDETWYLAGLFSKGPVSYVTRNCTIPKGVKVAFPVINSMNVDTPNVCGQGPEHLRVDEMRALSKAWVDGGSNLLVELDGHQITNLVRYVSPVFSVYLPEDNVYNAICIGAGYGAVPAGRYRPAADDGYYVTLKGLKKGKHKLHIHSEEGETLIDITYNLKIVEE